jgi:demethylspheroidene O-methyltransferase
MWFRALSDWWFDLRERLLSSPRFQRWAARFPLTRGVAERRASALFDLCAGFVYSQVLAAAVELRVMEALALRPRTPRELAPILGLSVESTRLLLEATRALELTERRSGDRFGLGIHGASYMGNPAVADMVTHHALLYRDLASPVALLRERKKDTHLSRFWSYTRAPGAGEVAAYSTLMARSVELFAEDVLEAYRIDRHRVLLDVGGGEAAFLEQVGRRAAGLELWLYDLPEVAERARQRLEACGLGARSRVFPGDVLDTALPRGADVVSLVRVLHDHDDESALHILERARAALDPGGRLLVAEPMAGTKGAERMGAAYFGFYLLAMGQGRPRTATEITRLLHRAGFSTVEQRRTRRPLLGQLLVATVR